MEKGGGEEWGWRRGEGRSGGEVGRRRRRGKRGGGAAKGAGQERK